MPEQVSISVVSSGVNIAAGAVTSVTAGTGLTGGNITSSGTIAADFAASGSATANKVVEATDSRLSNARTPTTHGSSHGVSGSDAIPADGLAQSQVANLTTDLAAKVPSTRQVIAGTGLGGGGALSTDVTLSVSYGTSSTTACVGNDARLTNPRTPEAHANTHQAAGSDPLTLSQSQITGLVASLSGKALGATQVIAGTGLTGGGDLTTDRTLAVAFGTTSTTATVGDDARLSFLASGTGATTRTLQNKLRDFASVKDFGAVGDGSTNDTAAIQAALSSGNKAIFFPSGTYMASGLSITGTDMILFGPGTIKLRSSANYPILTATSAHRLHIADITFDGNRTNAGTGTFAVQLTTTNDATLECVSYSNTKGALKIFQSPNTLVHGQRSYDFTETQVEINDLSHRTIVANSFFDDNGNMPQAIHVIDCEAQSADLLECIITGCVVQSVGTSVQFTNPYVKRCVVQGNILRNNSTSGQGNCIKMDNTGVGCVVDGNYLFFTNYGIIDASTTTTVVYQNNVLTFNPVATGTGNGFNIDSPAIAINNTVTGGLNDGYSFGSNASNCVVSNNIAKDCARDGFNVENAGTTNCNFRNNSSINCTRYGFRCDANSNTWINHLVKDCDGVYGAYVAGSGCEIVDCKIQGNTSNLVRFAGSATGCRVRAFTSSEVSNLPASSYLSVLDRDLNGTGSPEGVVTASIGAIYRRSDGGINTSLYIKQSGTGNTGWYAVTP